MDEEIEHVNQEEEKLTCPKCEKGFQDMRGLTSHARHMHSISRENLKEILKDSHDKNTGWHILSLLGAGLLAILIVGRPK